MRMGWAGEYPGPYGGSMPDRKGPIRSLGRGELGILPPRPHPKSSSSLSLGGLGVTKLTRKYRAPHPMKVANCQ